MKQTNKKKENTPRSCFVKDVSLYMCVCMFIRACDSQGKGALPQSCSSYLRQSRLISAESGVCLSPPLYL